ncbi:MAG TPA: F0F1 ATP synthase subunit alpha, partial [Brevibacterium sp.]|nr:F0F1 ATP synthase subunit alpha [Brevibacterium sp.]
ITLAQYRSMAAFAMFASDLDPTTRQQLTRGEKLMELLKQPQYSPYAVEDQVAAIWAGTNGYLDDVETSEVGRFEQELIDHLRRTTDVLDTIATTGKLEDETEEALRTGVEEFRKGFLAGDKPLSSEPAAPEDDPLVESEQEQIVAEKRG